MKEIIAATWKNAQKGPSWQFFSLGNPGSHRKTKSSVLYQQFSFCSLLSMPKTLPNHFCYCGRRMCNMHTLQMCLEVAEEKSSCCCTPISPQDPTYHNHFHKELSVSVLLRLDTEEPGGADHSSGNVY